VEADGLRRVIGHAQHVAGHFADLLTVIIFYEFRNNAERFSGCDVALCPAAIGAQEEGE